MIFLMKNKANSSIRRGAFGESAIVGMLDRGRPGKRRKGGDACESGFYARTGFAVWVQ